MLACIVVNKLLSLKPHGNNSLETYATSSPQAVLITSTMIPPMGQHHMKGTVAASNASLLKVCQGEGMGCVDHTSFFIAYSSAPRQDLYRDSLHPSAKGTGRLACNIKYADRPQQKPALLQTPSPLLVGQFMARQHNTNAWHSVQPAPGRLPSMMPLPNQRRGYNNGQQQPYRHFPPLLSPFP